jgi:hypothetical protein
MFWARQTILDGSEHRRYVTLEQRCGIEPQTGEDFTAEHSLRLWHQPFVVPGAEDEPLKQFSFDSPWHCFITAFKFVACEPISRLKRWGLLSRLLVISTNMGGLSYHRALFSRVKIATDRRVTIS